MRVRPRILSETSPGNFQAWCMMPAGVGSKTAMWALQELVRALGAGTRSAKMTQQGRLPAWLMEHQDRARMSSEDPALQRQ